MCVCVCVYVCESVCVLGACAEMREGEVRERDVSLRWLRGVAFGQPSCDGTGRVIEERRS